VKETIGAQATTTATSRMLRHEQITMTALVCPRARSTAMPSLAAAR
jgi:hypothetical protein